MNDLTWRRADGGLILPDGMPSAISLSARAELMSRLLPPQMVIGRRTAAWIWGLDVLPPGTSQAGWKVELLVPPGSEIDHPGCESFETRLRPEHVTVESGVRVTTPARTALDCARWLPRREAVAALDQFLRDGVDPASLAEMAVPSGYRRSKRLSAALDAADRGAASPGESWTRVIVIDAGFPRPRTQIPVMGPHGAWVYVDLGYEDLRVGLEYDGERHHSGAAAARDHDERRRHWLRDEMGWEIIPVSRDFLGRPAAYLEALLTAMLKRSWSPSGETMDTIATRLFRLSRPIGRHVR
ncbi:type IV toxin-antitoxin system AbiEi family antitoxin [Actinomadura sp. 6N118]|uniref:type IV toxin-antitoxin system AbiEi family antitoxin n=1 Tax=Actinomadura sp. 6N118 TaxID=3375151 RepID=UPI0037944436